MDRFSPLSAACGGVLIGLACAVLWLGNGRIAGISGMLGAFLPPGKHFLWRAVFLGSLVLSTLISSLALPGLALGPLRGQTIALVEAPAWFAAGTPVWIASAGLLVGLGTRIGNGCTSGHGVCGLGRLSLRSLVAVLVFFSVAIATVALAGVV